jgi:cell division septation protein DedD
MDKKRVQRVIGVVVIIALVIVLLPLLFGREETPTPPSQVSSSSPPPFPNQQPALGEMSQDSNRQLIAKTTGAPVAAETPSVMSAAPAAVETAPAIAAADNTAGAATGTRYAQVKYTENGVEITPAIATAVNSTINPPIVLEKAAATTRHRDPVKQMQTSRSSLPKSIIVKKSGSITEKNLAKLKKPAWVVQVGCFNNKNNAHRLANQLRSAGYKAFTHETKPAIGNVRTHVYIGPEFKEARAVKLSAKLISEMKLQGFVVAL